MLLNDLVSLFYAPIVYFAFFQMTQVSGSDGFNIFSTFIFFILVLLTPILQIFAWFKYSSADIDEKLWFMTLRVKPVEPIFSVVYDERSE